MFKQHVVCMPFLCIFLCTHCKPTHSFPNMSATSYMKIPKWKLHPPHPKDSPATANCLFLPGPKLGFSCILHCGKHSNNHSCTADIYSHQDSVLCSLRRFESLLNSLSPRDILSSPQMVRFAQYIPFLSQSFSLYFLFLLNVLQ